MRGGGKRWIPGDRRAGTGVGALAFAMLARAIRHQGKAVVDPALEQFRFIWASAGEYGLKALIALVIWFVGSTLAKVAGRSSRHLRKIFDAYSS